MWDEDLELKLEPFVGKKVLAEFDKAKVAFLAETGGSINNYDDFQIDVELVYREYSSTSDFPFDPDEVDEDEEVYDERRNWTVTHGLQIQLGDDWVIEEISVNDGIWGGEALGDENPEYIYTEEEYFDTAVRFMKAIMDK